MMVSPLCPPSARRHVATKHQPAAARAARLDPAQSGRADTAGDCAVACPPRAVRRDAVGDGLCRSRRSRIIARRSRCATCAIGWLGPRLAGDPGSGAPRACPCGSRGASQVGAVHSNVPTGRCAHTYEQGRVARTQGGVDVWSCGDGAHVSWACAEGLLWALLIQAARLP